MSRFLFNYCYVPSLFLFYLLAGWFRNPGATLQYAAGDAAQSKLLVPANYNLGLDKAHSAINMHPLSLHLLVEQQNW